MMSWFAASGGQFVLMGIRIVPFLLTSSTIINNSFRINLNYVKYSNHLINSAINKI